MRHAQHTLRAKTTIKGVGLHTGKTIRMDLIPAEAGEGIVFVRSDIRKGDNVIPALWDHVIDTQLCTVIGNDNGAQVGTIEHLMSALRGCGIDNLRIEIDGPEVPILDGSAMPFVERFDEVGTLEQDAPRRSIRVLKEVSVEHDGKRVTLMPSEESEFSGEINFDHDDIGRQTFSTRLINGNFKHDIAQARTFGFLHEVEYMRSRGLALGGSMDNAIVLSPEAVMNPEGLRYNDEFIRHKLLDAIGDLYLAGGVILGAYDGVKAGHMMNNKILHALFADPSNWEYAEDISHVPVSATQAASESVFA